jgi:magnesium transporter
MLRLFNNVNGMLTEQNEIPLEVLFKQAAPTAIWIDAHDSDDNERTLLQTFLHADLPETDDVEEIEFSARYFTNNAGIHIRSLFISQTEGRHHTASVAFILQNDRLISLREGNMADFRLLRMRARKGYVKVNSASELLAIIFEQKIENLADALEDIHRKLESVSFLVLEVISSDLEDAIDQLAKLEDSNGKIRLSLMDTQRSISFLQRQLKQDFDLQEKAKEILRDIDSLMSHTTFLFDKINFLMDSTQGFINIDQNKIIKIFSIASVVFLPPTLVASIYGMNFEHMPELNLHFGYPSALGLMVLSGIAPYWFFKRKGWL